MDNRSSLQAVLLCSQSNTSAMYYKTKYQLHNFTFYIMKTKDGYCYCWDEINGNLSSGVFAHIQHKDFSKVLQESTHIEKLIVWSDGCGYQNKNTTVSNMYLDLSLLYNLTIEQKYLVSGQTQMECDSMHSTIERKRLGDINTPRDYIMIFQTARVSPSLYLVEQLMFSDFKKLDAAYVLSIRPWEKVGDITVHNLRGLQYAIGEINYKICFAEEAQWEKLPHQITILKEGLSWVPMFQECVPISLSKYTDLQSMKSVIHKEAHHFL